MFKKEMSEFVDSLDALRDFVDLIAPFLKDRMMKQVEGDAPSLIPLFLAFAKMNPKDLDPQLQEKIQKSLAGKVTVTGDSESVSLKIIDATIRDSFDAAFKRLNASMENRRHLYRSALISLISTVEWYVASLLHTYFAQFKEAIGGKEKQMSLNDLKKIGSIDDAIKLLTEQKVEEILRGSFDDWITYLKETLKLSMAYLEQDNATLVECFQRRNLFVHNNGVVNNIYLAKVPAEFRKGLKVGAPILIDQTYVDSLIRCFERVFLLIGAELWKKVAPKDLNRGETLIDLGFRQLKREHWDVAEGVYFFLLQDKAQEEIIRLMAQINYWQCRKWRGKFDECKKEIEEFDFSAKDKKFELARIALLDKEKDFFALVSKLLRNKTISQDDLFEWPLFKEMRKAKHFAKVYGKRYQSWIEAQKKNVPALHDAKPASKAKPDATPTGTAIH